MHPTDSISFVAIDFETATFRRASICEAGICAVHNGKIVETRSWLVRPENNEYYYQNIKIHGIHPEQTINAPEFPAVWKKIEPYLARCPILVAHNAAFDIGCLRHSFDLYHMQKPGLTYYCTLRVARRIYRLGCNTLEALCNRFNISQGTHHRAGDDAEMCARLLLREMEDAGCTSLAELAGCSGQL